MTEQGLSLRDVPDLGVTIQVPTTWEDITDVVDGVAAAWAGPHEVGVFRSNVVITQDSVAPEVTWDTIAAQTWESSGAMLADARLLEEFVPSGSGVLSRWLQYRLETTPVILHQVMRRREDRLVTVGITIPTMTLPEAAESVRAIGDSLVVTGGAP